MDMGAYEVLVREIQPRGGVTAPATMRSGRLKKYWSWELKVKQ